jgi:hypothetical protein
MTSRAEVFRLDPFSFDPLERAHLDDLPPITPRFSLPSLNDGHASDRLLAGLRGGIGSLGRKEDQSSGKGKAKEESVATPSLAEETSDQADFWLNVVDSEPGPSKPRLHRVSRRLSFSRSLLIPSREYGMICVILSKMKILYFCPKRLSLHSMLSSQRQSNHPQWFVRSLAEMSLV